MAVCVCVCVCLCVCAHACMMVSVLYVTTIYVEYCKFRMPFCNNYCYEFHD